MTDKQMSIFLSVAPKTLPQSPIRWLPRDRPQFLFLQNSEERESGGESNPTASQARVLSLASINPARARRQFSPTLGL